MPMVRDPHEPWTRGRSRDVESGGLEPGVSRRLSTILPPANGSALIAHLAGSNIALAWLFHQNRLHVLIDMDLDPSQYSEAERRTVDPPIPVDIPRRPRLASWTGR